MSPWLYLVTFFVIILSRYFLLAGLTYWIFYDGPSKYIVGKMPQNPKLSRRTLIEKDIALSIIAAIATAICGTLAMTIYDSGSTRLYSSTNDYGVWYLVISFCGVILLQDSCYYFLHRGFHNPLVYNWLHRGHHRTKEPTPWTSFALDFPEALIQGLFLVAIVSIIPLHFAVLILWLITMTVWSLVNHLGFELFPGFSDHWLGKWFISSDHHSLHHHKYTKHYGLYFTFWDRLLGTN